MSPMKKSHPLEEPHKKAMLARTKLLRESAGMSQEKMAEALDVPLDRYRKYEIRTLLPHYLIEPFAKITGYSIAFVVTGRGCKEDSVIPYKGVERRHTS